MKLKKNVLRRMSILQTVDSEIFEVLRFSVKDLTVLVLFVNLTSHLKYSRYERIEHLCVKIRVISVCTDSHSTMVVMVV